MIGGLLIFGLVMQVKKDRSAAIAEEIRRNMEPVYVPPEELKLDEKALTRIQNLLDQVDSVSKGVENATSQVKSIKEGQ